MSHAESHQRSLSTSDAINRLVNEDLFNSEFRVSPKGIDAPAISACSVSRCGPVDVLLCEGRGPRYTKRAQRHIRADRADDILIVAPLKARVVVSQRGITEQVVPEGFACLASSLPLSAITSAPALRDWFSLYLVRIPAPLIRKLVPDIDDCCNRFVDAKAGTGRIMLKLFEQAIAEGATLTENQARRFGMMLIDAVANATAEAPEFADARARKPEPSGARIYESARAYIESHLSRATLSANEIAEHCGASRRYVDLAFAAHSQTVGGVMRESRLRACREDLLNPGLDHKTIAEIAFRWGFCDPAYFSRAYKARFGHSPKAARESQRSSQRPPSIA